MISKILTFVFALFFSLMAFAQDLTIAEAEDSLQFYFDQLFQSDGTRYLKNDSEKMILNRQISDLLQVTLNDESSQNYNFDKLNKLAKLFSNDNSVRIFTWDTQWKNHTHSYYGLIQYYNKKKKRLMIFPLIDKSDSINNLLKATLKSDNWYGALYYQMIPVKTGGRTYYTLIGFDQNNLLVSKKLIDVLYFTGAGKPRFGKRLFVLDKQKQNRVIFEYSAKIVMMMRYAPQYKMIVADHLAPNNPSYRGIYQFYGPDSNYIGFKFEKGKWVLYNDIDVKNPKSRQ
ncbi:MAG: hypothetical protein J7L46_06725 [Bacteroidales bacterium]|nr:hypothetical protein [Bacteroidales bacterium]